eukprot:249023-Chlamydomonas_euryale.AAC.1
MRSPPRPPPSVPTHQGLSNLLWAMAALGDHGPRGFLDALLAEVASKLPGFSMQGLSTSAWAIVRLRATAHVGGSCASGGAGGFGGGAASRGGGGSVASGAGAVFGLLVAEAAQPTRLSAANPQVRAHCTPSTPVHTRQHQHQVHTASPALMHHPPSLATQAHAPA